VWAGSALGQHEGLPFITNFSPKVYRQGPQNFVILQDQTGLLYLGNNNGVIVYDGHTWELVSVSNQSEVHALAQDANGKIYVGAQGEFGYLEKNSRTGVLEYVSMLHLIPQSERNFNDIWNIYPLADKLIVRTTAGMFLIHNDNSVKTVKFLTSTHRSFLVNNEVFIREENFGLRRLEGDTMVSIPGGQRFLHDQVYAMVPISQQRIVVHSQNSGLWIYDGKDFTPFESPANKFVINQGVHGRLLPDGTIALGTRRDGLIIINEGGEILQHLSTAEGLINESIWGVEVDKFTSNLWVATNNGLSFVETQSPFTSYQSLSGLPAQVYHMVNHRDVIYAATSLGVYYKELSDGANKFNLIQGLEDQAWAFHRDEENLLVATNRGIFSIEGTKATSIGFTGRAWLFVELKKRPGFVMVNSAEGFVILKKEKQGFVVYKTLPRFYESLYYFSEDENGNVWADSPIKGIYKIVFDSTFSEDVKYSFYNSKQGLPSDYKVMAFNYDGGVRFTTEHGIYRYDPASDLMLFDKKLNQKVFGDLTPAIEWMEQDSAGNIWFITKRKEGQYYFSSGGFSFFDGKENYYTDLNTFWRIHEIKIRDFLYLGRNRVFIGTSEGIFHFNPEKISKHRYPVSLRSVTLTKSDSTFSQPVGQKFSIPFEDNSIKFRYAAMGFGGNPFEYQSYLEGLEDDWQPWATASERDFQQLPPGDFVFHLRAKDLYNNFSEELTIPFKIVTPWFKTPLAYSLYGALLILTFFIIIQWRSKSLMAQNVRLEKIVSERTAALAKAQITIAGQNDELKNVNQNLEKKVDERTQELQKAYQSLLATKNELDTFIYRSSHDIKGPLLRLLGLCNVAMIDVKDPTSLSYFKMLEKEIYVTNRILQKLIVYYYVKNADVNIEKLRLKKVLTKVLESMQRIEGHDQIKVVLDPSTDVELESDSYLLETSLHNVIENAITYRRNSDARVNVSVSEKDGCSYIMISDNGKGISKDVSKHIFEMFYRGSEYSPGAGLGLFITNLALKKINGSISFEQREETVFRIAIPSTAAQEIICVTQ
jgi:signal transduction histidine kinase/ligand-binding sensor domain-containing protein